MHSLRRFGRVYVCGAILLALLVSMSGADLSAVSRQVGPTTTITHTPPQTFVPGFRISIKALVADEMGIAVVRCYFRATGEADYVFVEMRRVAGNLYAGILPAPSPTTEAIEYILLAVNYSRVVVRSQVFTMARAEGTRPTEWQTSDSSGQVSVKTELAQAPQSVAGFTDSIASDVVESAFRFGYVVKGLHAVSTAGPPGYTGATVHATAEAAPAPTARPATTSTTTAAKAGGSGTKWLIIGSALAGGGAAGYYYYKNTQELTPESIIGTWSYRGTARGYTLTGVITFKSGGNLSYTADASPISNARSGVGSWMLSGGTITILDYGEGWSISGPVTGDKKQFSASGDAGSYTFTRR